MNINRIAKYIDYNGFKVSHFEKKIGISNGAIRKAIKNNTDIQSKWISSILDNYTILQSDWLLTGTGNMCDWDKKSSYVDGREEVVKRLMQYLASEGISVMDVNHMCGWSKGNLQKEIDKGIITADHLFRITRELPELNPNWLMINEGTMKIDSPTTGPTTDNSEELQKLKEENERLKKENEDLKQKNAALEQDKLNQQTLINLLQGQQVKASPSTVVK